MKKWKIIVSIVVLILAAGAGSIYYLLKIKDYETTDTKVEDIVEEKYDIKLPDEGFRDDANQNSAENNTAPDIEITSVETTNITSGVAEDKGSANTSMPNNKQKTATAVTVTATAIIERYQPSFNDLENQASTRLNTLLSHAFNEYKSKKANDEAINYFYFLSKYETAAEKLEASTDESFEYIFAALVSDLKKAGFKASEAQYIEDHYRSMKKERRSSLIGKAKTYINI
ncbi:hypothetical protein [Neobacillus sp. FSL H8-0543]|uniref:hypothetical protein n=1 Tax=Neobacillus sp. FSL H8-0543 TaxID=2954672 RepID=UPI00315945EC